MNLENQPKKKLFYIWLGFQSVCYVLHHSLRIWSHQEINVGKRKGTKLLPSYK